MTKALMIGGGLGGLVAAVEMARRGRAVTVLEASSQLGGRAQTIVEDGFAMNLGPHALYPSAEARLRELGVELTWGVPTEGLTMEVGDRFAPLPVGTMSLLGNGALSWREKVRLGAFLGALGRMDAAAYDDVTVAQLFDDRKLEGVARGVAEAAVRVATYCNAPDRLSAGTAIRQIQGALPGVLYLDGGWATILDALRERAESLGVELRTGAKVEAVERGERRLAVRLRGGEVIDASAVVLTLSPKASVRVLGDAASSGLRRFASEAVAVRAACLDVGLRRLPRRHPGLILGTDEPTYVSNHSNVAKLAPEGAGLIHLARYLAPDDKVGPATRAHLESYLDVSQPGWRDELVHARWAPAMLVSNALPEARLGGQRGRPATDAAGVPGVALAGDWVGPTGFLAECTIASSLEAARHLCTPNRAAA